MTARNQALLVSVMTCAMAGALLDSASCSYPTRTYSSADEDGSSSGGVDASVDQATPDVNVADTAEASITMDAAETAPPMDVAVLPGPDAAPDGRPCAAVSGGEQDFPFTTQIVGCLDVLRPDAATGGTLWVNRAMLCGVGCRVCTAQEWIDYRQIPAGADAAVTAGADAAPLAPDPLRASSGNYWVDDDLVFLSGVSTECAVGPLGGSDSGVCGGRPIHVCVESPGSAAVTDHSGDTCQVHDCGYLTASPDLNFGGCGPDFAGTLCCCNR
jgi:hypothetical protein